MRINLLKFLSVLLLFLLAGNLNAQVPDGGIMLNATNGTTYRKVGPGILTQVSVEGQSFDKALRFEIAENFNNTWGQQIQFPAVAGIETNDIILVAFYARTTASLEETGDGYLNVILENNTSYAKEISHPVTIGQEWKEYYASTKSTVNLATSEVSYTFHCGFANQTIEVADVRYLNYKNTLTLDDLPETQISYAGQDPDASWRISAAERIQQNRKGPLDVVVYDESGLPLEGATVSIEMMKHDFKFGSAVSLAVYRNNPVYKSKIYDLFNEIVWENDLKWPQLNPKLSNDALKNAMIELADSGISVRGHCLIWPSWNNTPSWLEDYKADPAALRREISSRIKYATNFTKGYAIDWDVINEPYTNHDLMDILGYESMAEWFKRVKLYDKDVKLYMNDYSIISSSGTDVNHQDHYFETIQSLMEQGAEVDGIGMQGHIGGSLTPITKIYEIVDRFAALGLEIKITENDIDVTQREVQAEYLRDFMTILFSHSSVKGILSWGFWAGQHWKPDGAYYDYNWNLRPHGQMFLDLVYDQWWTHKTDSVTNQNGETTFEGFLGEYKYTISHEGKERSGTFSIDNSFADRTITLKSANATGMGNQLILSFDEDIPDKVKIERSGSAILCEGESLILSAAKNENLSYKWYKGGEELSDSNDSITVSEAGKYSLTISKGNIFINSDTVEVSVNPLPAVELVPPEKFAFCEGDDVVLSTPDTSKVIRTWYNNDEIIEGSVLSINPVETGDYTLHVSQDGCTNISDTISLDIDPQPQALIKATGDLTFCLGGSVRLTAYKAYGYDFVWMKGDEVLSETANYLTVNESGDYKAIVSLDNCSNTTDVLTVNVLDPSDPACAVGIKDDFAGFMVYPNPFHESFYLEIDRELIPEGRVELFNSLGSKVYSESIASISGKELIQIPEKGLYILKISGREKIEIIRLIGE